jgi:hypothetical protein
MPCLLHLPFGIVLGIINDVVNVEKKAINSSSPYL